MEDRRLAHRVVSREEMAAWPVDRKRSGEKMWAETTWGGDTPGRPKLFNWNIWPCRIVFQVGEAGDVARGEAVWRRSARSIRMKGLKLLSAATGEEIADARLVRCDQERVAVDFRPVSGPGAYHLYYGACEPVLFRPSEQWLERAEGCDRPVPAMAVRVEARCALDCFHPMETIALHDEVDELLSRFPDAPCLVFPEDRDRPIKLLFEIPAHWALEGPKPEVVLEADRNEYRVFQLGIWACRKALADIRVTYTDLAGKSVIPARRLQCLTLESRVKSRHIRKPTGPFPVPKGQVRAVWIGVDVPEDVEPGEYRGSVTVHPQGRAPARLPVRLIVSENVVPDKGDHDLARLSRLRWLESDIGLSDEVHEPYAPLKVSSGGRAVATWGHTLTLNGWGMPEQLTVGDERVMAVPVGLTGSRQGLAMDWRAGTFQVTEATGGHVRWRGQARTGPVTLEVDGLVEYDGCAIVTLRLEAEEQTCVEDLSLAVSWRAEHARLASGMGYRGRREQDRIWRRSESGATCFSPAIWLGSVNAGMGWITWATTPWEDVSRTDAATVTAENEAVVLRLNLGRHRLGPQDSWQMQFALLPTPVKPHDRRHWQFRYMHLGGDFMPSDYDTPQSFLRENANRLDELVALGVRRLNLHDWWGPMFNYPCQWEGPDNLSRLAAEAHKRGIRVKVYNSGRELSTLAPEFWGIVYEGASYPFPDSCSAEPRGRFQDAWHENHLPDGLPQGWPRVHELGNEHSVPVSNATRNGNFYLESIRYMTENFGTDGAYWDGADGPTLGHREMAKRLCVLLKAANPDATIDVHHGNALLDSPITSHMLCFPFIDSIWHGEGFPYDTFGPWEWLVEISGLPFGVPSEMLGGELYLARGMLFGIWPRAGWCAGTEKQGELWAFFDRFGIEQATMHGWWEECNGVTVNRPETYVTAFTHPANGVLLVMASWHPPIAEWMEQSFDVSLRLDRATLGLPAGFLRTTDVFTGEELEITDPVPLPDPREGRLLWVRRQSAAEG